MYGVQAGHNPVLVALHMGIAKFTVDGETREVLVGDGIAEVTPTLSCCWWTAPSGPKISTATAPRPPASGRGAPAAQASMHEYYQSRSH